MEKIYKYKNIIISALILSLISRLIVIFVDTDKIHSFMYILLLFVSSITPIFIIRKYRTPVKGLEYFKAYIKIASWLALFVTLLMCIIGINDIVIVYDDIEIESLDSKFIELAKEIGIFISMFLYSILSILCLRKSIENTIYVKEKAKKPRVIKKQYDIKQVNQYSTNEDFSNLAEGVGSIIGFALSLLTLPFIFGSSWERTQKRKNKRY